MRRGRSATVQCAWEGAVACRQKGRESREARPAWEPANSARWRERGSAPPVRPWKRGPARIPCKGAPRKGLAKLQRPRAGRSFRARIFVHARHKEEGGISPWGHALRLSQSACVWRGPPAVLIQKAATRARRSRFPCPASAGAARVPYCGRDPPCSGKGACRWRFVSRLPGGCP